MCEPCSEEPSKSQLAYYIWSELDAAYVVLLPIGVSGGCAGIVVVGRYRLGLALHGHGRSKVLRESGDYQYVEKDYIFTNQMLKKPTQSKPATAFRPIPKLPLVFFS